MTMDNQQPSPEQGKAQRLWTLSPVEHKLLVFEMVRSQFKNSCDEDIVYARAERPRGINPAQE